MLVLFSIITNHKFDAVKPWKRKFGDNLINVLFVLLINVLLKNEFQHTSTFPYSFSCHFGQ